MKIILYSIKNRGEGTRGKLSPRARGDGRVRGWGVERRGRERGTGATYTHITAPKPWRYFLSATYVNLSDSSANFVFAPHYNKSPQAYFSYQM